MLSLLHLLAETSNVAGDPDTWPEAAVWIVAIVMGGLVWIAWLKWGDR